MIKTIKAQVDRAIIGDLPKYFGGWEAALREVFQNAHRAGATKLDIIANDSETVITITDNGEGCADPEVLLFAKRSTWDPEKVVDAAGLGVFSLLNPEIVAQVYLASHDWQVTLMPQAVAQGKSFEVTPYDTLEGFLLIISLVKPQTGKLLDTLKKVRELYPFTVTFNGAVIEAEKFAAAFVVETPAGTAYWRESNASESTRIEAAWEYRRIYSESFREELRDAAARHPHSALAHALYKRGSLRWFINPECGVRPKLPDRSDLIAGESLQAAARMIVNALTKQAMTQFKTITAKWPDRLPTRDYSHNIDVWGEVPVALRPLSSAAVQCLGWRECIADDMLSGHAWDDDGIRVEYDARITVYDKTVLVTDDVWLAETLNNLFDARGNAQRSLATLKKDNKSRPALEAAFKALAPFNVVACFDEHAEDTPVVKITGLRVKHAPKEEYKSPDPFIALAERITFNGVELPFLLGDTGNEDQPVLIIAGSAEDAVRLLKSDDPGGRLLWHCVMAQAQRSSLWDDDWAVHNDEVDEAQVLKDLVLEVTENFGDKKTLKARQTHAQLSDALTRIQDASLRIPFKCEGNAAVSQSLRRARKEIALAEKLTRKAMTRVAKAV